MLYDTSSKFICSLLQKRAPSRPEPPLLAALRAEERWQAEQGPEQAAALALRIERAKATRPCASLACPNLAANPQLRGRTRSACRAVRYCCGGDQVHDWREGGHRAACCAMRVAAAAAPVGAAAERSCGVPNRACACNHPKQHTCTIVFAQA